MAKNSSQSLLSKIVPKKVLDQNTEALKFYEDYKKTAALIEQVDIALGKKATFKAGIGSTLNFEINARGIASTAA